MIDNSEDRPKNVHESKYVIDKSRSYKENSVKNNI